MKTFQRYFSSNFDENKDYFISKDALVHRICAVENDELTLRERAHYWV